MTTTARTTTTWLPESIVYQVYLRAFTPEGTLGAATVRLPELADLGVDILYLCPVCVHDDDPREEFWSPRQKASGCGNPKNPYRMKDYYAVEPEYGTDADLQEFIDTAHKLGMRVLLDIVFLHCGPGAVFIDEHPDFVERDEQGNITPADWGFPKLNFANPELREYLWRNLEYWITDFGVDGYRCDVSASIPLDFWEEARRRLEAIAPEVVMLSESHRPEEQLFAFDVSYSFAQTETLYRIMKGEAPASAFRREWEAAKAGWPSEAACKHFYVPERPGFLSIRSAWPRGSRFIRYIDNHDLAHDHPERIETLWGPDAVKAALALVFTLDGIPMLYNGQEVADAARHTIFGKCPIDWANGERPAGRERRDLCRRLCALRHAEPALTRGDLQWLDNDQPEHVLSFVRSYEGRRLLIVLNLTRESTHATLSLPASVTTPSSLMQNGTTIQPGTPLQIEMDAYGYWVGRSVVLETGIEEKAP
jgi:glycosidase